MALEFRCPGCQKLLRTPDESAGKKARCPDCGTVTDVPMGAPGPASDASGTGPSNPFADSTGKGEPAPPSEAARQTYDPRNPYAAPTVTVEPTPGFAANEALTQNKITIEQLVWGTYDFIKANFGMSLLFGLMPMAAGMAINFIVTPLNLGAQATRDVRIVIAAQVFGQILSLVMQTFVQMGAVHAGLHWMRTGVVDIGRFFQIGRYLMRGVLIMLLTTFIMMLVMALTCSPGIVLIAMREQDAGLIALVVGVLVASPIMTWIGMRIYLAMVYIVDRNAGVMESLRSSDQAMQGNKLAVLVTMLLGGVVSLPVMCFTCGVGTILIVSTFSVARCLTYLLITGQPYLKPVPAPTNPPSV